MVAMSYYHENTMRPLSNTSLPERAMKGCESVEESPSCLDVWCMVSKDGEAFNKI